MHGCSLRIAAAVAALVLGALRVGADELLGLYAGIAVGRARLAAG
jgi:hypothetical protein